MKEVFRLMLAVPAHTEVVIVGFPVQWRRPFVGRRLF